MLIGVPKVPSCAPNQKPCIWAPKTSLENSSSAMGYDSHSFFLKKKKKKRVPYLIIKDSLLCKFMDIGK